MALPHIGSWGLPDFGITEAVGGVFGAPKTTAGGSNLFGAPQASTPPTFTPSTSMYSTVGSNSPQQVLQPQPTQTQPAPQPFGGGNSDVADWLRSHGYNNESVIGQLAKDNPDWLRSAMNPPQAPDYSNQINDIYNPLFSSLNDQSSYIQNTQLPQSLGQLEESRTRMEEDLAAKKQQSEASIALQQEALGGRRLSALQEARNAHKALLQQSQARFGGRGSAAMAATEIASKEFARAQGRTEQGYTEQYAKLMDYQNQVENFALTESRRISREHELEKQRIQAEAQQRLFQIQQNKNELESAKSTASLQLVQEAQARINALSDARTQSLIELSTWKSQQDWLLKNQYATVQAAAPVTNYENFFTTPSVSQQSAVTQPQYISQSTRPDEMQNLVNPFA